MINTIVTENTHTQIPNRSFSSKTKHPTSTFTMAYSYITHTHLHTYTQTPTSTHTNTHTHRSLKKCYYKTLSTIEQFVHLVPTLIFSF